MRRRGVVVALSGIDSSGKSTQRERLVELLSSRGQPPVTVWSRPGYGPGLKRRVKYLLRRVRRLLSGRRRGARRKRVNERPGEYPRRASSLPNSFLRRLWITSAIVDLLWLYAVRIRLHRAAGRDVICDRYLLDCSVDFRVNFPDDRVEDRLLHRLLKQLAVRPDAAFCLLVPVEESMRRSRDKDRYHWETREVLEARHAAYRSASAEQGVAVLDGTRSVDDLAAEIEEAVRLACGETRATHAQAT